nr:MAG TPA: hypothetical protein [Caudoviricetes sp.]
MTTSTMAGPFTLTSASWYGSAIVVSTPSRCCSSSTSCAVGIAFNAKRFSSTGAPGFLLSFMWVDLLFIKILKSDAALEQVVDGTVEHFGHLLQFGLRDVSVDHPVIDCLTGDSQLLCKLLDGELAATPFCVDVRIEQCKQLLSCNLLLVSGNYGHCIPKMSKCKAKKHPNRAHSFCEFCSIRVFWLTIYPKRVI